jgi:hypothetical protein
MTQAKLDNDQGQVVADNETGLISIKEFEDADCPKCFSTLYHGRATINFDMMPTEDEQYAESKMEGTVNAKRCLSCGYLKIFAQISAYDAY